MSIRYGKTWTLLPLLLTAVNDGRLTLDDIFVKSIINPRKIFNLPEQPETWIEVDKKAEYEIRAAIHAFENAVLKLRHGLFPVNDLSNLFGTGETYRLACTFTLGSVALFDFPAGLLPVSFPGQGLLDPELLTRLEVKGVTFHLLNNVLLLDFTLEAAKGVF